MSRAIHCDGPSCITWVRDGEKDFIEILEEEDYAFCSWECVIKFAATKTPIEEIII